jgi:peptidoglycan/LPS O-acetylase OafA/YrhL
MVFYLLIPAILFVNYFLLKGKTWLIIIFTGTTAILTNYYLTPQIFSLYGMANQKLHLYFGVFLSGITVAFIRAWILKRCTSRPDQLDLLAQICSVVGSLTLLFLVFCSTERLWGGTKVFAQLYFGWYGGAAALLILCISFAQNTRLERFLTWLPLSCIGIVSFSYYLFHPLVLNTIFYGSKHFFGHAVSGVALFVSTAIVSYVLACFIYHTIEKPLGYST